MDKHNSKLVLQCYCQPLTLAMDKQMKQRTLKNVNNCLNTNIYSYLETPVIKIPIHISLLLIISTPELIRHLWQLKTVVLLHRCLICSVLLAYYGAVTLQVYNVL